MKVVIDCRTKEIAKIPFTDKERKEFEKEINIQTERQFIESVMPTEKEIRDAEIEIKVLTLLSEVLSEVGLI